MAVLPGLFGIVSGVDSAIQQSIMRSDALSSRANSYVDLLNSFNAGQNTLDNQETRFLSAQQPLGTPLAERFNNIAQSTTNPFVISQALAQQQSIQPLLALSALQNNTFARNQGLPTNIPDLTSSGFFGANPAFQQQFNQGLLDVIRTNNAPLNAGSLGEVAGSNVQQQLQLLRERQAERREIERDKRIQEAMKANAELRKQLAQQQRASIPRTTGQSVEGIPTTNSLILPLARPGG